MEPSVESRHTVPFGFVTHVAVTLVKFVTVAVLKLHMVVMLLAVFFWRAVSSNGRNFAVTSYHNPYVWFAPALVLAGIARAIFPRGASLETIVLELCLFLLAALIWLPFAWASQYVWYELTLPHRIMRK